MRAFGSNLHAYDLGTLDSGWLRLRRFCDRDVEWRRGITATMRQTHAAGEKLFADFAGDTVPVFDALTGEARAAKIFVAVLGASNYTSAKLA